MEHQRLLRIVVSVSAIGACLVGVGARSAPGAAPPPVHGAVVPETPVSGWPRISNGSVDAAERVGQFLILGGTFTTIVLPNGSSVNQPYLAAFDVDTGQLSTSFHPVLDRPVSVLEAGDQPGTVYAGGLFKTINGVTSTRLAKLDVITGQLVSGFSASVNGEVTALARTGNRLFVGGEYTTVNSQPRGRLAEISAQNGSLSGGFTITVTGSRASGCRSDGFCYTATGPAVRALHVTPNGGKLIVQHRGDRVGGLTRWGVAVIDISATPTVTSWRADLWDPARNNGRTDFVGVIEGDMSPDGSLIAFSNAIGNFPPLHDTVIAFPVNGGEAVQPLWVTQNFDSTYGIAVSDQATYMGGHFCWTESQQSSAAPMYWPNAAGGNQYSCAATGGGVFQPQTTLRHHLGAIDLPTGRAVAWNPGSNDSTRGVQFLRTFDRGLIMGHDGSLVRGLNVGRSAVFDFGISKEPRELAAPTLSVVSPTAGASVILQTVTGTALDDYRIKRVRLRLKDTASGLWVQANGSLSTTAYQWEAVLGPEGISGTSRVWTVNGLPSPVGQIEIQARSADLAARTSPWVAITVTGTAFAARVAGADPAAAEVAAASPEAAPATPEVAVSEVVAIAESAAVVEGNSLLIDVAAEPETADEWVLLPWRHEVSGAVGLAVAGDGTVVRVGKNGKVSKRSGNRKWDDQSGPGADYVGPVAVISAGRYVAAGKKATFEWDGSKRKKLFDFVPTSLAASADGTVAAINPDGGNTVVIRENGQIITDEPARWIAVQAAGQFWKVGADGNIYRGRPGQWQQAGDQATSIAVSPQGVAAAVLPDGTVATFGADGVWSPVVGIPVAAAQVAINGEGLYALGVDLNVYRLA